MSELKPKKWVIGKWYKCNNCGCSFRLNYPKPYRLRCLGCHSTDIKLEESELNE